MIVALLLLTDLLLMLWLIWCLTRKQPSGQTRSLGILSYVEDRELAKAEAQSRKRAGPREAQRKNSQGPRDA
jgi:hypothetical protein